MGSNEILEYLYRHPEVPVALDTETTGLKVYDDRDKAIGLSIAYRGASGQIVSWYWGVRHRVGKHQNIDRETAKKIRYVLEKQHRTLYFANVQFDIFAMRTFGIDLAPNPFLDVLTAQNFIFEEWTQNRRGLDELAAYWECGRKVTEWEYVKTKPGRRKINGEYQVVEVPVKETTLKWQKENGWRHTTPEMLFHYASIDAEVTLEVAEKQLAHPEWKRLPSDVWEHKQDLIRSLMVMRSRGILIDQEMVQGLYEEGEAAKQRIKDELGLNPASRPDLIELMINRLGLPVLKETPTGQPNFDKSVMPEYDEILERDGRPEAKLIREYRGWQTAVGLLLKPYLTLVSPDGRLRTSYTTHQTVTGRLSAREPNLQQISKDGGQPWNDRIKHCFIARPGYSLLSVDYSQLELRVATAYSQEPALLEIFEQGRDIFTEMTQELIRQFERDRSPLARTWTRNNTKTLVYSIQYGGGVKRVKNAFGVTEKEAKTIIQNFYRSYRRFRRLDMICKGKVNSELKLRIWTGRYRHFRHKSDNYKGMNSLIQGGAADIVERVLVYAMKNIDCDDCMLLLQVHDELVFEVRTELVEHYTEVIKKAMSSVNEICNPGSDEPLFPVVFSAEVKPW